MHQLICCDDHGEEEGDSICIERSHLELISMVEETVGIGATSTDGQNACWWLKVSKMPDMMQKATRVARQGTVPVTFFGFPKAMVLTRIRLRYYCT